jgi:hypothetical protein
MLEPSTSDVRVEICIEAKSSVRATREHTTGGTRGHAERWEMVRRRLATNRMVRRR